MIDINNKIFHNTYGSGFATLLDVAINNALHSQYSHTMPVNIRESKYYTREPVQDIMNSGIKMRVEKKINAYEY